MTFAIGIAVGMLLGAICGGAVVAVFCWGRIADLQEANDAWEATRWDR